MGKDRRSSKEGGKEGVNHQSASSSKPSTGHGRARHQPEQDASLASRLSRLEAISRSQRRSESNLAPPGGVTAPPPAHAQTGHTRGWGTHSASSSAPGPMQPIPASAPAGHVPNLAFASPLHAALVSDLQSSDADFSPPPSLGAGGSPGAHSHDSADATATASASGELVDEAAEAVSTMCARSGAQIKVLRVYLPATQLFRELQVENTYKSVRVAPNTIVADVEADLIGKLVRGQKSNVQTAARNACRDYHLFEVQKDGRECLLYSDKKLFQSSSTRQLVFRNLYKEAGNFVHLLLEPEDATEQARQNRLLSMRTTATERTLELVVEVQERMGFPAEVVNVTVNSVLQLSQKLRDLFKLAYLPQISVLDPDRGVYLPLEFIEDCPDSASVLLSEPPQSEENKLESVARMMQNRLPVRDRRQMFRTYRSCFDASASVDWVCRERLGSIADRETACALMTRFQKEGWITAVPDPQKEFRDKKDLLFRFTMPERRNSKENSSTASTSVYCWGHSVAKPSIARFPVQMEISQIACGTFHSIALSNTGQVLSWGRGYHGELGHGQERTAVEHPTLIRRIAEKQIAQIAAHGHKSAVISLDGVLYLWGHHGVPIWEPIDVELQMVALKKHKSKDSSKKKKSKTPSNEKSSSKTDLDLEGDRTGSVCTALDEEVHIKQLVMGRDHLMILAESSGKEAAGKNEVKTHVYSWGRNDFGQLGFAMELQDLSASKLARLGYGDVTNAKGPSSDALSVPKPLIRCRAHSAGSREEVRSATAPVAASTVNAIKIPTIAPPRAPSSVLDRMDSRISMIDRMPRDDEKSIKRAFALITACNGVLNGALERADGNVSADEINARIVKLEKLEREFNAAQDASLSGSAGATRSASDPDLPPVLKRMDTRLQSLHRVNRTDETEVERALAVCAVCSSTLDSLRSGLVAGKSNQSGLTLEMVDDRLARIRKVEDVLNGVVDAIELEREELEETRRRFNIVFERDDPTLTALFDVSPRSLVLEFFAQPTAGQVKQRVFTKLNRALPSARRSKLHRSNFYLAAVVEGHFEPFHSDVLIPESVSTCLIISYEKGPLAVRPPSSVLRRMVSTSSQDKLLAQPSLLGAYSHRNLNELLEAEGGKESSPAAANSSSSNTARTADTSVSSTNKVSPLAKKTLESQAQARRDSNPLSGIFDSMSRMNQRTSRLVDLRIRPAAEESSAPGEVTLASSSPSGTTPAGTVTPEGSSTAAASLSRSVGPKLTRSASPTAATASSSTKRRAYFIRVPSLESEHIRWIAAGSYHSCALTDDGRVFTWGRNVEWAPLGCAQSKPILTKPRVIGGNIRKLKVVWVACGHDFNVVVTATGAIYGWGNDQLHQLQGVSTATASKKRRTSAPVGLPNVASLSAAKRLESEAISSAFPDASEAVLVPTRLRVPRDFGECSQVECGYDHCVALNYTGDVCSWGNSQMSQCGTEWNPGSMSLERFALHTIPNIYAEMVYTARCGPYSTAIVVQDSARDMVRASALGKFATTSERGEIERLRSILLQPHASKIQVDVVEEFQGHLWLEDSGAAVSPLGLPKLGRAKPTCESVFMPRLSKYILRFGLFNNEGGTWEQYRKCPLYQFVQDSVVIRNESEAHSARFYFPTAADYADDASIFQLAIHPSANTLSPRSCRQIEFGLVVLKSAAVVELVFPVVVEIIGQEERTRYMHFLAFRVESESLLEIKEVEFSEIEGGEMIGRGGSGTVRKVTWNDKVVAVKEFLVDGMEPSDLQQFRLEIIIASKISHPNIVDTLAVCTVFPHICLVLDYYSLGDLRGILDDQSHKISPQLRLKIAADIARGMIYLHKRSIIHKDLKSENIMMASLSLDESVPCAKIADFGASTMHQQRMVSTDVGTVRYQAPELFQPGRVTYNGKVDVYSFSIILWELVTRESPYPEMQFFHQVETAVLAGIRPPLPETVRPEGFADLIKDCWNADPDARPSFDEILNTLNMMDPVKAAQRSLSRLASLHLSATRSDISPRSVTARGPLTARVAEAAPLSSQQSAAPLSARETREPITPRSAQELEQRIDNELRAAEQRMRLLQSQLSSFSDE
mmetsp:Transcript_17349/g.51843  ORF Transcript_17349/g.51843 Transcript_17349/m.51843 type:complete len:2071 (-) Transcript_17349:48-6260(-)